MTDIGVSIHDYGEQPDSCQVPRIIAKEVGFGILAGTNDKVMFLYRNQNLCDRGCISLGDSIGGGYRDWRIARSMRTALVGVLPGALGCG